MEASHNGLPVGYGPGFQRSVTVGNLASGGVIGTAAATVDIADVIFLNQTTASKLISLPTPTDTSRARNVALVAASSAALWTNLGRYIAAGGTSSFTYKPGVGWVADHNGSAQLIYITNTPANFPADTNENNIDFVTIPGGFMGANSIVQVGFGIENTSGTSNKTVKAKFGAFTFYNAGYLMAGASGFIAVDKSVMAANSATAQVATGLTIMPDNGSSAVMTLLSGTVDTASDVLIRCSVQKTTGADVCTIRFARLLYTHGS